MSFSGGLPKLDLQNGDLTLYYSGQSLGGRGQRPCGGGGMRCPAAAYSNYFSVSSSTCFFIKLVNVGLVVLR